MTASPRGSHRAPGRYAGRSTTVVRLTPDSVRVVTHAPLDLLHLGDRRRIGAYLLDTDDGPALFDCGPTSCVPALRDALGARGLELGDVRHLLLSHIHLDHAGAAGVLARENPALTVHVSEVGLPHLVDPERLETSARRLYGDAFDELWGELAPVSYTHLTLPTILLV